MIEEKDLPLLIKLQKLILSKGDVSVTLNDFINLIGYKTEHSESDFEALSEKLVEYDIAEINETLGGNSLHLLKTNKTHSISIEDIFKSEQNNISTKNIEDENTKLTNESLKYEQTIRAQDQKIRNLTEENLSFEKKERWVRFVYFILGNVFMFIGANFKDISIYVSNLALLNNQQESVKSVQTKNQTESIQLSKQNDSIMK